jgi:LacI family transcriptional regulator
MASRSKPPNSTPTLVHVARLAGVGLGTASRALSGQGYVSEDTSARIRTAVEQLGYQRNELARSLKRRRSSTVGLVMPNIGGPFMATCVRSIQKILRQGGYNSIIAFTDGSEKVEAEEISYLLNQQVDGLIVVPSEGRAAHFNSQQLAHTPLVAFDQPIEKDDCDAILVKNRQYAQQAVEHLIAHGHKRIACLGVFRHLYSIQQRIKGYAAAMKAAGLPPVLEIVDPEDGGIGRQLEAWLKMRSRPTALFCLNELTTLETVKVLTDNGVHMPEQMAFIGFDDIQLGAYFDPPLTVVVQPAAEIGERAAAQLLQRIEAKEIAPARRVLLDASLIIRGSCGCPVERKSFAFNS